MHATSKIEAEIQPRMLYDVAVIGGSAAGLAAAIYSARQGMGTIVVRKDIGGQMLLTNEIKNYLGIISTTGFRPSRKAAGASGWFSCSFVCQDKDSFAFQGLKLSFN